MSIAKRVGEAIEKMNIADTEAALFQICSAVDATSALVYQRHGAAGYKSFIHDNLGLITKAALGVSILNMNLKYDINAHRPANLDPIPADAGGAFSIEQIIYHVVRCCLYHEARLPTDLVFTDERKIVVNPGHLAIPAALVNGLIVAVAANPVNAAEQCDPKYGIMVGGLEIPLNKLWGKKDELLALYAAIDAFK